MRALAALGLVLAVSVAHAENDPAVAKRLFGEGRVLYDQGKFLEACVLFEKSYQLDPAVGTKLNLAECAERDNKPRAAWLMWISAAEEFERNNDSRSKFARKRADALATKLATVVIKMFKPTQKGLAVTIAGREVTPAAKIVERLEPGDVVVSAKAPERESFETTVAATLGGSITVEVPALAKIGGIEDEPEKPVEVAGHHPWWKITIASGVLTALSIGGYVYAAGEIKRVENALDEEQRSGQPSIKRINALNDEGFTWQTRTRIALGVTVGSALLTTFFVYKAVSADRKGALQVTPTVGPEGAGAQLQVSW